MKSFAIDTETTGIDLNRGCAPFMVIITDDNGETRIWDFDVNPYSRVVIYRKEVVNDCVSFLRANRRARWFFWNLPFDIAMLSLLPGIGAERCNDAEPRSQAERVHPRMSPLSSPVLRDICLNSHDGLVLSHMLNSGESHGLKDFAVKYLDIPDYDEARLETYTQQAHSRAERIGWAIATKKRFPSSKKSHWKADYWLCTPEHAKALDLPPESCLAPVDPENPSVRRTLVQQYGESDGIRTFLGVERLLATIESDPGLSRNYHEIHRPVSFVGVRQASVGIGLHMEQAKERIGDFAMGEAAHTAPLTQILGKPYCSTEQSQKFFIIYEHLKVKPTRFTKKSKQPATDKKVFAALAKSSDPRVASVVVDIMAANKYRVHRQYVKSYCRDAVKTSRGWILYPELNQTGTRTTRYSSRNPNGQNIGAGKEAYETDIKRQTAFDKWLEREHEKFKLRNLFGPPAGFEWLCNDYEQLQLMIFAYACDDKNLIAQLEAGEDYHTAVARIIFGVETPTKEQRRIAKNVNFGFIFGAQRKRLESESGMSNLYDILKKRFAKAVKFLDKCSADSKRYGFVETLGGYRIYSKPGKHYAAVCDIVQGTEGEIVKRAMVLCDQIINRQGHYTDISLPIQVHDELVFQGPSGYHRKYGKLFHDAMVQAGNEWDMKLRVNCELVTSNWADGLALPQKTLAV